MLRFDIHCVLIVVVCCLLLVGECALFVAC